MRQGGELGSRSGCPEWLLPALVTAVASHSTRPQRVSRRATALSGSEWRTGPGREPLSPAHSPPLLILLAVKPLSLLSAPGRGPEATGGLVCPPWQAESRRARPQAGVVMAIGQALAGPQLLLCYKRALRSDVFSGPGANTETLTGTHAAAHADPGAHLCSLPCAAMAAPGAGAWGCARLLRRSPYSPVLPPQRVTSQGHGV